MLVASCNTSFSSVDSRSKGEEELRLKRARRLQRRRTSSMVDTNGIGALGSPTGHMNAGGSGGESGGGAVSGGGDNAGGVGGSGSGNAKRKETLRFNIRGTRFLVHRSTLEQTDALPSRLTCLVPISNEEGGDLVDGGGGPANDATVDVGDHSDYHIEHGEYYFDRNPHIFGSIIDYYATGEMHLPENMCVFAVKKELEFWDLEAEVLASCCWNRYCKAEEDQRMLHSVVSEWASTDTDIDQDTYNAKHASFKKRMWLFLNEPHTSLGAKIWSVILVLMIVASIVVLSLETVLQLRQAPKEFWLALPNITDRRLVYILENSEPHDALVWIEIVTLIVLTFEFVARLGTTPDRRVFCKGLLNIADLLSIIPIWVMIGLEMSHVDFSRKDKGAVVFAYYFMMLLRMLRLFRLFKLVKHYKTLKILLMAIKASYKELILLIILLSMGVIIYANLMFFVEVEYDNFMSIPDGFWWAIITMTTVGYGDLYPKSALGQVIGSACAITGILVIALPVPVIANNFHAFYASAQAVQRMREREEKEALREESKRREDKEADRAVGRNGSRASAQLERGIASVATDDDGEDMAKFPEALSMDNHISRSPEKDALTMADCYSRV